MSVTNAQKLFHMLLVEDMEDHAELMRRVLQKAATPVRITVLGDGDEALDYFFRRGRYADPAESPRPNLILLDLRLPKVDGLEVLRQIKSHEELRALPVVIFSSSDADADVLQAYRSHANSYVVKPADIDELDQLMENLTSYWSSWNEPGPADD